ncbi:non-ribosomal peptide synthetase [Actinoplanes sp. NPDC051859]|uniref:non-ribosomal peptide synthetase n=1 Tax=Actinoplanes sp. NPDC051859 TaxID=3363909 RepID=UPI0037A34D68
MPGRTLLHIGDPWAPVRSHQAPPAAPPDPERVAYLGFTSGSTGEPKAALIPQRGVLRLARDPELLVPGATERFVRLAPLAFDASTLEIFAPLLAGGTIDVFGAGHPTPAALAAFLADRDSTGLWLTAGLFRLVADYQPEAFGGLRQVLTGGDVVPPAQVARVLTSCPGLRVTNGYGPTENTTFTTTHTVADPAAVDDPLPIGRPVGGTGVVVLDRHGRPVPPGGVGELYTSGAGLALGYAGRPRETAAAFIARDGELFYRTGDLVRWDRAGRLRFLGRSDRQVKIRGFRIELDAVARTLREHPEVRDVAVLAAPGGADRRLLAALVADDRPGLVEQVRRFAADRLPGYAVPSLWTVVAKLPVTRNGKLDAGLLRDLAAQPVAQEQSAAPGDELTATITRAWAEVLGTARFGLDERFFEVGGDSLRLLRVAASLRRELPSHDVTVQDLFACQTIRALSGRLSARTAR